MNNQWCCYLLGSLEGNRRTYIGATPDLAKRLWKHNTGRGAKYTRGGAWTVVAYVTGFPDKRACLSFESGWKICYRRRKADRFRVLEQLAGYQLRYNGDPLNDRLLDLLWFTSYSQRWEYGYKRNENVSLPLTVGEALVLHLRHTEPEETQRIADLPWPPYLFVEVPSDPDLPPEQHPAQLDDLLDD